MNGFMISVVFG